jgi:CheY-like chemotaxis protein
MNLAGKRLFLVEDSRANQLIVQIILEQHGALLFAEHWEAHITPAMHKALPLDAVLLDLLLANNTSGYDVFTKIRAEVELAHIPIVAVSTVDPAEAIPKAREMGFAGFIHKPLSQQKFPLQIAAILNGENIWDMY